MGEVVSCDEVGEMGVELIVVIVMEMFYGSFFDCLVYLFDLVVGLRVVWFG